MVTFFTVLAGMAGGIGISHLAASAVFRAINPRPERGTQTAPLSTVEAGGRG
jgi:hypothetical protein